MEEKHKRLNSPLHRFNPKPATMTLPADQNPEKAGSSAFKKALRELPSDAFYTPVLLNSEYNGVYNPVTKKFETWPGYLKKEPNV